MGNDFSFDSVQRRKIELINVIIYSIYGLTMSYIIYVKAWPPIFLLLIFILMVTGWSMYLAQFRTYRFRTFTVAIIMQISVFLYSIQCGSLSESLYTIIAVCIIMGLYGIPEMNYLSIATSTALLLIHLFILKSVKLDTDLDYIHFFFQALAIFIVEFVIFYYEKTHLTIQDRMSKAITELTYAERSKDNFLANVSHELRTPINTICGMSEIIMKEDMSTESRNDIYQIQMAGRNLHSIVSDIFDFYELEYGNLKLVEEEYNISSTINNIINMTNARKHDKKIELVVDCDSHIPSGLVGDELKIRRIIMNIINNSIKFTEDGCVSITFGFRKEEYGINLLVSVKDTGIGIKKADLEQICNGFYQADMGRSREKGGIGIGLSISHALIKQMGGFLSVDSEYGRGTNVQFVIPQKVSDERPIVSVNNAQSIAVICYVNLELFELTTIRDEYTKNIQNMVSQNDIRFHMCKNFAEFKRRMDREQYTHIFIGLSEYEENRQYFDEVSMHTRLILSINQGEEQYINNARITILYKPFFILPIAMILNGDGVNQGLDENSYHHEKFIAPNARILAVDDNEINLMVLKGLLAPFKMQLVTVNSGREALLAIEDKNYDLVLMDHMMPEMDGVECFHKIRQKPESYFKNVPIIALTANAIGGAREHFMEEGFQDFVSKPIEVSVLTRVLRRNIPPYKIQEVDAYEFEKGVVKTPAKSAPEVDLAAIVQDSHEEPAPDTVVEASSMENAKEIVSNGLPSIVDTDLGETYCGTAENLEAMLHMHCDKYNENRCKIIEAYNTENWKDYTTHVHGIKSTMMSVGLKVLSETAKALEMAGKSGDTDYIHNNHKAFLDMYSEQMNVLADYFGMEIIESQPEDVVEDELPDDYIEVSSEDLQKLVSDFEGVLYSFNADSMLSLIHSMDDKSFKGKALVKELEPVVHKIEMSDFMSASDYLSKLVNRIV